MVNAYAIVVQNSDWVFSYSSFLSNSYFLDSFIYYNNYVSSKV